MIAAGGEGTEDWGEGLGVGLGAGFDEKKPFLRPWPKAESSFGAGFAGGTWMFLCIVGAEGVDWGLEGKYWLMSSRGGGSSSLSLISLLPCYSQ